MIKDVSSDSSNRCRNHTAERHRISNTSGSFKQRQQTLHPSIYCVLIFCQEIVRVLSTATRSACNVNCNIHGYIRTGLCAVTAHGCLDRTFISLRIYPDVQFPVFVLEFVYVLSNRRRRTRRVNSSSLKHTAFGNRCCVHSFSVFSSNTDDTCTVNEGRIYLSFKSHRLTHSTLKQTTTIRCGCPTVTVNLCSSSLISSVVVVVGDVHPL